MHLAAWGDCLKPPAAAGFAWAGARVPRPNFCSTQRPMRRCSQIGLQRCFEKNAAMPDAQGIRQRHKRCGCGRVSNTAVAVPYPLGRGCPCRSRRSDAEGGMSRNEEAQQRGRVGSSARRCETAGLSTRRPHPEQRQHQATVLARKRHNIAHGILAGDLVWGRGTPGCQLS
jgi:hypothetical protein